jgi:ABC-type multidrug transport system ATPase subunit
MLYVTHDPVEANEICEEILILAAGRLLSRGNPRDLLG